MACMRHLFSISLMTLCVLAGCGGKTSRSQWEDIDYTPVYRAYEGHQNDTRYTQPSIIGCVDDDLYNCK